MAGNGGRRPGAGRYPKGSKAPQTLEKEFQREVLRQQVFAIQGQLVKALARKALGLSHFMLRDTDGTFKRLTDEAEIEAALNSGNPNAYWIDTKDPDVAAAKDLLDRALDKPTEAVSQVVSGTLEITWKGRK